jgi:hypothetical protein
VIVEHVYEQRVQAVGPHAVTSFEPAIHRDRRRQAFFGATTVDGQPAVLKLADPYAQENRLRVTREADALTALGALPGTAVVRLLDRGSARLRLLTDEYVECPYVVLERLGGDAYEWTGGGRRDLAWRALRRTVCGLATGLAAIHDAGWIHGDVKLDNVLLRYDDRIPGSVWGDFGAAVRAGRHSRRPFAGHFNEYQPADERLSPAWDVYGFGVLLHTLTRIDAWRTVLLRVAPGTAFRPTVPAGATALLDTLLTATLDPSPDRRPTAREVAEALDTLPADAPSTDHETWQATIEDLGYVVNSRGAELAWAVHRPRSWPDDDAGVKLHVHLRPDIAAETLRLIHPAVVETGSLAKVPANLRDLDWIASDPTTGFYGKVMTIYPANAERLADLTGELQKQDLDLGPGVPHEERLPGLPGGTYRCGPSRDPHGSVTR